MLKSRLFFLSRCIVMLGSLSALATDPEPLSAEKAKEAQEALNHQAAGVAGKKGVILQSSDRIAHFVLTTRAAQFSKALAKQIDDKGTADPLALQHIDSQTLLPVAICLHRLAEGESVGKIMTEIAGPLGLEQRTKLLGALRYLDVTVLLKDIATLENETIEIKPGLYVASKIVDGKPLYFAFQTQTKDLPQVTNMAHQPLVNFAYNVGSNHKQSLKIVMVRILEACKDASSPCPEVDQIFDEFSPMKPDQKQRFLDYVLGSKKDRRKLIAELRSISEGAQYMFGPTFAFISTKPVDDYRDFGYAGQRFDMPNLEKLYTSNQDLVVIIQALLSIRSLKAIEVRAIFKPPHEFLYGDHKNISLLFHGFVAHIAKLLGREVYTIPDPVDSMANILKAAIDGKEYRGVRIGKDALYGDLNGEKKDPNYHIESFKPVFLSSAVLERLFTESR